MSEQQQRRRRRVRMEPSAAVVDPEPAAPQLVETPDATPVSDPADAPAVEPGAEPVAASVATSPVHDEPAPWVAADPDTSISERGLRGLVGGGSSQITPASALRARDAARPRPDDLARAEAELTIVRRNWAPRD